MMRSWVSLVRYDFGLMTEAIESAGSLTRGCTGRPRESGAERPPVSRNR